MKKDINRRAALTGLAALASTVLPGTTMAHSSKEDAELLRLIGEVEELTVSLDANWAEWKQLSEEASKRYPPMPEVTWATRQDLHEFQFPAPKESFERAVAHYSPFMRNELANFHCSQPHEAPLADWLSKIGVNVKAPEKLAGETIAVSRPWPEAITRRDEIVAAIDSWADACVEMDRQQGLSANEKVGQRLCDRHSELLDQIEELRAHSLEGLIAKARAIATIHRGEPGIEFGSTTDEVLACQIVNALLELDHTSASS